MQRASRVVPRSQSGVPDPVGEDAVPFIRNRDGEYTMSIHRSYASSIARGCLLAALFLLAPLAQALDNGLARTPPMGWNSWNRFGCNINETLIKQTADAMVASGMKAAGYTYVNLDDCWQVGRDSKGQIVADPVAFPSGIKALADYVHKKGLKLGVYSDRGSKTCQGRPGSEGYEAIDAKTYAAWGVDYLKHDNCNSDPDKKRQQYELMTKALAASGRKIAYSICAWGFEPWMPAAGNLWRTTGDIEDSWRSMLNIVSVNSRLAAYAGPGAWNDPDMLEVGNGGMSDTEYRTQFGLWAIMAAPLIAGNDLRNMSASTREILTNPDVIAVNQDALGVQGYVINSVGDYQTWMKRLAKSGTRAIALQNNSAAPTTMTIPFASTGLDPKSVKVRDLWARKSRGSFDNSYAVSVPPHGTALLVLSGKEGTPPVPLVKISTAETRAMENLTVAVEFTINGARYSDWEDLPAFDRNYYLGIDGWKATPDAGGVWKGDLFYQTQPPQAGARTVSIQKVDGRSVSQLRVSVRFQIGGQSYVDYEDIDPAAGPAKLLIDLSQAQWNGSEWIGNFLHP